MLNLSCGYYLPHQPDEYIDLAELEATLAFNVEAVRKLGGRRYEHKATRSGYLYGGNYGGHYGGYTSPTIYQRPADPETKGEPKCDYCEATENLNVDDWGYWCDNCGGYNYKPKTDGNSYPETDDDVVDWIGWDE